MTPKLSTTFPAGQPGSWDRSHSIGGSESDGRGIGVITKPEKAVNLFLMNSLGHTKYFLTRNN